MSLTVSLDGKPTHIVVWKEDSMRVESSDLIQQLLKRVTQLEDTVRALESSQQKSIPFFPDTVLPSGIEDVFLRGATNTPSGTSTQGEDVEEEEGDSRNVHVIKEGSEEAPVAPVSAPVIESQEKKGGTRPLTDFWPKAVSSAAVAVAEDEGEEEETGGEELTEFQLKGVTYYRDSEMNVFMLDEDGDLDNEPIGQWNEEKKKIVVEWLPRTMSSSREFNMKEKLLAEGVAVTRYEMEKKGGEVEEEVEEGGEVEEEVEEEGEALEEFEWKGVTYYRDSEMNVFQLDENGDLNDEPIGRWSEEKQKILKFAKQ